VGTWGWGAGRSGAGRGLAGWATADRRQPSADRAGPPGRLREGGRTGGGWGLGLAGGGHGQGQLGKPARPRDRVSSLMCYVCALVGLVALGSWAMLTLPHWRIERPKTE
jgi:hypothetical protein